MPDIKTKVAQDKSTNNVCPISGCIANKKIIGIIAIIVNAYFKYIWKFFSIQRIEAIKMITKGLTSSIGWKLGRKKRLSHLLDPFTSVPKIGTKNKKNKDIKNKYKEILNKFFSLNNEKKIKTTIPIEIYTICLKKKK